MVIKRFEALFLALALAACSSSDDGARTPDGGAKDTGTADSVGPAPDAGAQDSATPTTDVGTTDVGTSDGGTSDGPAGEGLVLPPGDAGVALCNQLADDFALALDILKECDPGCDCCTQEVLGIVFPGCPCPTYVNPAHASMITKLDSLRGQYAAYGCPDKVCKCKKPTGGLCLKPPTVEVGHCGDRFD